MLNSFGLPRGKAALVVGHPGHELRVFHWLERAHPEVFVLTDGSGTRGEGRIDSTTDLVHRTGSECGSIYGAFTDLKIYELMLDGKHQEVCRLADQLAENLLRQNIDYVVGDACEGYNPTHDICRMVIGAAVTMAGRRRGFPIGNYDFLLTGLPKDNFTLGSITIELDDADFARKVAAARGYRELSREVDELDRKYGLAPFRTECLRPVDTQSGFEGPPQLPPYYETYGQQQIAAGKYHSLLTYQHHVRPLAEALRQHVAAAQACRLAA
jgi:hypothetical protein